MSEPRRILTLRCRAERHVIAWLEVDDTGEVWLCRTRPRIAVLRGDRIGHDYSVAEQPDRQSVSAWQRDEITMGLYGTCACGVDFHLSMPNQWDQARAQGVTTLLLDPATRR